MASAFDQLLARMQELRDLSGVIGLATWDQETFMPKKADGARASQLSTLQGLYHERLVDPAVGDWLHAVATPDGEKALSNDQRAMVRVFRRERDRAVKVPKRLVTELATAQSQALSAWRQARTDDTFAPFQPRLEQLLRLRREQADAIGHSGERYDALLEAYEPGMQVRRLSPVLEALQQKLVPLVQTLTSRPPPRDVLGGKRFARSQQWQFTLELLGAMGFDRDAGRQDESIHPFTGGTHPLDVRLTTRVNETNLAQAIFGTVHECGHGLYEQGFAPQDFRTPLAQAPSMGLHESQSRLWENIVGRSAGFWSFFYPRLQGLFGPELGDVPLDDFVACINRVERSLIRVDADEVTYNLHIALRYQLELQLLREELPVSELPQAWSDGMQRLLGIRPPTPLTGVLQDIHWAWGEFGYFPTYALGNLYSASLFAAAKREAPQLTEHIARGELLPLRDWLRKSIHVAGYRVDAEELVTKVTGRGLTDEDFVAYLKAKYSALYRTDL